MRPLFVLCLLSTTLSAQLVGDTETGLASYYSREYDGAETAYNLTYDRNELVAAHRSWPVNSIMEVRNLDNNESVRVRVIDKGPFIRGRVVEVSERAAGIIGLTGKVTVPVEVTLRSIGGKAPPPGVVTATNTPKPSPVGEPTAVVPEKTTPPPPSPPAESPAIVPAPRPASPDRQSKAAAPVQTEPVASSAPTVEQKTASTVPAATPAGSQMAKTFAPGVYQMSLNNKPDGDYAVQVGTYSELEAAVERVAELQAQWFRDVLVERTIVTGGSVYKVMLGPFTSEKKANSYSANLKAKYRIAGFVVRFNGL